jgi:hypothetical protein
MMKLTLFCYDLYHEMEIILALQLTAHKNGVFLMPSYTYSNKRAWKNT